MGDFLAELFDQFDPEEQAAIRAAEDATKGILAEGTAAVRDRQLAAGSSVLTDWVLEPEDDARADAAGVVFAAYVKALWRQTDLARSESIQEFGAKVDKLVAPVLARYGREGEGNLAELREKCWRSVQIVLQRSTLSEASGATEHGNIVSAQLGDDLVISVKPDSVLQFVEPCRIRQRRKQDLEAWYGRRRNGPEADGAEDLLRDARAWAEPVLRELVSEVRDVFELKGRVVNKARAEFVRKDSYFDLRHREFASALWEEGWPSLEDLAIVAIKERATSAASQAEAVVTGSLAEERGVNPARLAGIPLQGPAHEAMTDLPKLPSEAQAHLDGAKRIAQETLGHARIHLKRAAETKGRLEALGFADGESTERVELQGQYDQHLENASQSVQTAIRVMFDAYAAKHWQAVCPDTATFSGQLPAIAREVESSLTCPELASTIAETLRQKTAEWADKMARSAFEVVGGLQYAAAVDQIVARFRREYAKTPDKNG